MTQSKNVPELNNSSDKYYFNAFSKNHDCFMSKHTFTINVTQLILGIAKMVLITKFNSSGITKSWFCILEEKLPKQLIPTTWRKQINI